MTKLPKMSESDERGDRGRDRAERDVGEDVQARGTCSLEEMQVIHHRAAPPTVARCGEFLEHALHARGATAFDQHEIAGARLFDEQVGSFRVRRDVDAVLEAGGRPPRARSSRRARRR